MTPMQRALGADWQRLPRALQSHYQGGVSTDAGHLDVEFPACLQPVFTLMRWMGALLDRRGRQVSTAVVKRMDGERQHWHRTLRYKDGREARFDSVWVPSGPGLLIEYVNPWLGLEMRPHLVGDELHYAGVRFVLKLGSLMLSIPQWLGPGVTAIQERALDEHRFAMDFQLTHPWFGQVYRYSGEFEAAVDQAD
jgi:hypothetical protein